MPAGHHARLGAHYDPQNPKGGRPRKTADPDRVLMLFRQGLTVPEVAKVLDMHPRTLRDQIRANPVLAERMNAEHVQLLASLSESLRARALEDHAPSMRMLLERLEASRI